MWAPRHHKAPIFRFDGVWAESSIRDADGNKKIYIWGGIMLLMRNNIDDGSFYHHTALITYPYGSDSHIASANSLKKRLVHEICG